MLVAAPEAPYTEQSFYRGYVVETSARRFRVIAPNGETATLSSTAGVRAWVRWHRKQRRAY